jgi:hypothetical protein
MTAMQFTNRVFGVNALCANLVFYMYQTCREYQSQNVKREYNKYGAPNTWNIPGAITEI